MKKYLLAILLAGFAYQSFSQELNYKIMQTGSMRMDDDDSRNLYGLSIVLWVATESQVALERDSKALAEELSKPRPDKEKVEKLKKDINQWEETTKVNRIGNEEILDCSINYIFDSQNKLRIVGKTRNGDELFEFGKGHNQQLFLYDIDDNEGNSFYVGVFDNGGSGLIGVIEQRDSEATIYIGNVKKAEYMEFVKLYIMPNGVMNSTGEYTPFFKANEDRMKSLKQNLLKAFPKDSDGDRWMLCK
mgnify:CR=1 FL=1